MARIPIKLKNRDLTIEQFKNSNIVSLVIKHIEKQKKEVTADTVRDGVQFAFQECQKEFSSNHFVKDIIYYKMDEKSPETKIIHLKISTLEEFIGHPGIVKFFNQIHIPNKFPDRINEMRAKWPKVAEKFYEKYKVDESFQSIIHEIIKLYETYEEDVNKEVELEFPIIEEVSVLQPEQTSEETDDLRSQISVPPIEEASVESTSQISIPPIDEDSVHQPDGKSCSGTTPTEIGTSVPPIEEAELETSLTSQVSVSPIEEASVLQPDETQMEIEEGFVLISIPPIEETSVPQPDEKSCSETTPTEIGTSVPSIERSLTQDELTTEVSVPPIEEFSVLQPDDTITSETEMEIEEASVLQETFNSQITQMIIASESEDPLMNSIQFKHELSTQNYSGYENSVFIIEQASEHSILIEDSMIIESGSQDSEESILGKAEREMQQILDEHKYD